MARLVSRALMVLDDDGRIVVGRYTGSGYPFGADEQGTLGPKSDLEVIVTSMANILTTPKGDQVYDETIGSVVPLLMFDILDEVTLGLIRYYTVKDLSDQESRIVVHAAYARRIGDNAVKVTPVFSIVGDPTQQVHNAPLTFQRDGEGL
jgi:phage baseplate assembly protein W